MFDHVGSAKPFGECVHVSSKNRSDYALTLFARKIQYVTIVLRVTQKNNKSELRR